MKNRLADNDPKTEWLVTLSNGVKVGVDGPGPHAFPETNETYTAVQEMIYPPELMSEKELDQWAEEEFAEIAKISASASDSFGWRVTLRTFDAIIKTARGNWLRNAIGKRDRIAAEINRRFPTSQPKT